MGPTCLGQHIRQTLQILVLVNENLTWVRHFCFGQRCPPVDSGYLCPFLQVGTKQDPPVAKWPVVPS